MKNKLFKVVFAFLIAAVMIFPVSAGFDIANPVESVKETINDRLSLDRDITAQLCMIFYVTVLFAFPVFFYRYEKRKKLFSFVLASLITVLYLALGEAVLLLLAYFDIADFWLVYLLPIVSIANFAALVDKDIVKPKKVKHPFALKSVIVSAFAVSFLALCAMLLIFNIKFFDLLWEIAHLALLFAIGATHLLLKIEGLDE